MTMQNIIKSSLFPLGQLVMTRGVADQVAEDSDFAKFCLRSLVRHAKGDWGDLCKEDAAENEDALKVGNRLMSVYKLKDDQKIYIITEWDRSVTTILWPSDY